MDLDLRVDVAELTARLVDFESVSGGEQALADAIEAALGEYSHLTVERDGNAGIAPTGLGPTPRVALAGHIDTVPIADNVPSRVENGILYGCGTSDMKSGVAVQLALAATVAAPVMDVTYVVDGGREIESEGNGLLRVATAGPARRAADFAVLLEPTAGVVEGG